MIEHNASLTGLFPTPILTVKRPTPFTEKELSFVVNQEIEFSKDNGISLSHSILDSTELLDLKSFCQTAVNLFTNQVYSSTSDELDIGISWINSVPPDKHHGLHSHKNAIISGVYYFQNTKDCELFVQSPLVSRNVYDFSTYKENNHFNSETFDLPVEENTLILFPGWLQHGVRTNTTTQTRYSIAFNTWFKKDSAYGFPPEKTFLRT